MLPIARLEKYLGNVTIWVLLESHRDFSLWSWKEQAAKAVEGGLGANVRAGKVIRNSCEHSG